MNTECKQSNIQSNPFICNRSPNVNPALEISMDSSRTGLGQTRLTRTFYKSFFNNVVLFSFYSYITFSVFQLTMVRFFIRQLNNRIHLTYNNFVCLTFVNNINLSFRTAFYPAKKHCIIRTLDQRIFLKKV